MANLTLKDLTAPIEDIAAFLPPASSAYRSYLYPGFWGGTDGLSTTPNPVSGSDAVAAPSVAEFGYNPPAPPSSPSFLQTLTSTDPTAKGTSVDERAANVEQTAKQAGVLTNPDEALKALGLATSFTSPTGLAALAATTGLSAAGVDPKYTDLLGDLTGTPSNPFDFKSNLNARPGWNAAFDEGLTDAHRQGYSGQQASQRAINRATETLTGGAAGWGRPGATQPRDAVATPTQTQDVTSLNAQTGFGAQNGGAGAANGGLTGAGASNPGGEAGPASPASTGRPSGYSADAYRSADRGGGGNDHSGANEHPDSSRGGEMGGHGSSYNKGGVVKMHPKHRAAARDNHNILKQVAERAGTTVPQIAMRHQNADGELGARARLEHHVMMMACGGTARRGYATGGVAGEDPSTSMQYNPPPEATAGNSDTQPAMLTPGELVVTKAAAEQYPPEVKAALNDPQQAAKIAQLIEAFLNNDEETAEPDDGAAEDASENDDNHGMGVAGQGGNPMDPRSTMNAIPRGGTMLRNLTSIG